MRILLIVLSLMFVGCATYSDNLTLKKRVEWLESQHNPAQPSPGGEYIEDRVNNLECRLNADCNESGRDVEEVL